MIRLKVSPKLMEMKNREGCIFANGIFIEQTEIALNLKNTTNFMQIRSFPFKLLLRFVIRKNIMNFSDSIRNLWRAYVEGELLTRPRFYGQTLFGKKG